MSRSIFYHLMSSVAGTTKEVISNTMQQAEVASSLLRLVQVDDLKPTSLEGGGIGK